VEVQLKNVDKHYGKVVAVQDVNLTIADGALHFFLGPSGCGKTTTLRMLAGLEFPTSGKILFDGKDVTNLHAAERGIGMVFQSYALWPHMTVRANIEYGLKLRKLSSVEIQKRLDDVLQITQLIPYVDRLPGQLSGGQQQRVALARAMAIRPTVLLLDEPLSNLDAQLRLEMRDNISRIHRETKITTVYVTHDQKEALSMGTEVSVMLAGNLAQTDAPRRLYDHPNSAFVASFIGETNLVPGKITAQKDGLWHVTTAIGDLVSSHPVAATKVGDQVMLSMRPEALAVHFNDDSKVQANRLPLKIDHITYLGESEQFQLRHREIPLKATVYHTPEHDLKDGDMVDCSIAPVDVLILPAEK